MKLSLLRVLISFLCIAQTGLSLFGMESNKPVAHVITYSNGQEEERIAIDQGTFNVLINRSETIANSLHEINNKTEIHLPDLSLADFNLAVPYLKNYDEEAKAIKSIMPPNNLSDLIRLFNIADYLDSASLLAYIVRALKEFDIKNLTGDHNHSLNTSIRMARQILDTSKTDIDDQFGEFTKELQSSYSSKIIKNTPRKDTRTQTSPLKSLSKTIANFVIGSRGELEYQTINYPLLNMTADKNLLASRENHSIKIFDTKTGQLMYTLNSDSDIKEFDFSPQETFLIAKDYHYYTVWNLKLGTCVKKLSTDFQKVVISPDDTLLAIINSNECCIKIFDLQTNTLSKQLNIDTIPNVSDDIVRYFSFSPNSKMLALGHRNSLEIWDTGSWKCKKTLPTYAGYLKFSPFNTLLINSCDKNTQIFDIETGECLSKLDDESRYINLDFNRDGSLLAISGKGTIQLWDVQQRKKLETIITSDPFHDFLTFSPDGSIIASRSENTVSIWQLHNRECIETFRNITGLKFSNDSTLLALGTNDVIQLFDLNKKKFIQSLQNEHNKPCYEINRERWYLWKFIDDESLLTAHLGYVGKKNKIQLWDIPRGKCLYVGTEDHTICDNHLISKENDVITLLNLANYKKIYDEFESLSPEKKLLLLWCNQAKKNNVPSTNIEQCLNTYLPKRSTAMRNILDKTFNVHIKPYQPLTDLANTAKKAYVFSISKKKS